MDPSTDPQRALALELTLGAPVDNRFGLVVPELVLTIRNPGSTEVEIPEAGLPMLLALRTRLVRDGAADGAPIERSAGTGKPMAPRRRPLGAGEAARVTVSPLDDGPGESPLDEGTWTATICLGAACSNPVALVVAKR